MIMLIGIVKKNAIMMIDFALTRQRSEGVPAATAIFEAALVRFRPIMMTTMAALMGTLPIAIGLGSGSEARRPLGLAVVGGLLLSQLLTLYITPVIYVYLDRFGARLGGAAAPPAKFALRPESAGAAPSIRVRRFCAAAAAQSLEASSRDQSDEVTAKMRLPGDLLDFAAHSESRKCQTAGW